VPFFPLESADIKKAVYEQTWIEVRVDGLFRKAGTGAGEAVSSATPSGVVDVNRARTGDLAKIPELKALRKKILANRPYTKLDDLVERHVLSKDVLKKIEGKLTVGPGAAAPDPTTDTFTRTVVGYTRDLKSNPEDRADVLAIYKSFISENDDLEKSWNVTGKAIVEGAKLSLTEPEALAAAALDARKPVAVERTRTQIPADKPLYFQIEAPHGGNVPAGLELAPNGTLAKGSSQVQDTLPGVITQTAGSVLSAALGSTSLNTVASHFLAPAKPPQSLGGPTVLKVDLKLTTVRRLYTVTITRPSKIAESACGTSVATLIDPPAPVSPPANEPGATTTPSPTWTRRATLVPVPANEPGATPQVSPGDSGLCRATLAVEIQRGDDDKPKNRAKDDPDAISISGTIKPPKAASGDGTKTTEDSKK
jgi:hypothetical protein